MALAIRTFSLSLVLAVCLVTANGIRPPYNGALSPVASVYSWDYLRGVSLKRQFKSRVANQQTLGSESNTILQFVKFTGYSLVTQCNGCNSPSPTALPSDPRKKGFIHVHVLVGTLIGAVMIVMACWLIFHCLKICCIKLAQTSGETREAEKVLALENDCERQPWMLYIRRFYLKELEAATKKFSSDCLIGSGAFGKVYKGVLDTSETVAIKRAYGDSYQGGEDFQNEVKLLSEVRHKNLITLLGFCEEAGEQILVYEYVPNGSLLEHISGQRGAPLTWKQRVQIAIGAAKGITHLHEGCKPAIIHRDIKPSNILLDYHFEAKVSDFGLVRSGPVGDESHVSTQVKGTPGYLDPHYYSSLHLTTSTDVYSFGVILLQLVTARPAVDPTRRQSQYNIIDWARPSLEQGILENVLDSSLLTQPYNQEIMLHMGQLGLRCVRSSPNERPTMRQVCYELESALAKIQMLLQRQPSRLFNRKKDSSKSGEKEEEQSESFVNMEKAGLQKFYVDLDDISFNSLNMRCLECNSIGIDMDSKSLVEMWEEGYTSSSINTLNSS